MKTQFLILTSILVLAGTYPSQAQWTGYPTEDDALCVASNEKEIWIGTDGKGAIRIDRKTDSRTVFSEKNGLKSNAVKAILIGPNGRKWIGTDEGVTLYDDKEFFHFNKKSGDLPSDEVNDFALDVFGNVWIATSKGAIQVVSGGFDIYDKVEGLPSEEIECITTRNIDVIVGTDEGMVRYDRKVWTQVGEKNGLPSNDVKDVEVMQDGSILVLTNDGVSKVVNNQVATTYFKDEDVTSMSLDQTGVLWLGTEKGLLKTWGGGFAEKKRYNSKNGLLDDHVLAVHVDYLGNKWIATEKGVNRFNDGAEEKALLKVCFEKAREFGAMKDHAKSLYYYRLFLSEDKFKNSSYQPDVFFDLANIYQNNMDFESANKFFEKFVGIAGNDDERKSAALKAIGDNLFDQGKLNQAESYYKRYVDDFPKGKALLPVLENLASIYEKLNDNNNALIQYKRINESFPVNPRKDYYLARMYLAEMATGVRQTNDKTALEFAKKNEAYYEIIHLFASYYEAYADAQFLKNVGTSLELITNKVNFPVNHLDLIGNDLWVSTNGGGIVRWKTDMDISTTFSDDKAFKSNFFYNVRIDQLGEIWAASGHSSNNSSNGGIANYYNDKWFLHNARFKGKFVRKIAIKEVAGRSGNDGIEVWAATNHGLVSYVDNKKWSTFTIDDGLPSNGIQFIEFDPTGLLWFVTDEGDIGIFDKGKASLVTKSGGILSAKIRDFAIDNNNRKLFATDVGVFMYEGKTWSSVTKEKGILSDDTYSIAASDDGKQILVGTAQGLSYFNGKIWVNFTDRDGMPVGPIRAVTFGRANMRWLAVDNRVFGFEKSSQEEIKIALDFVQDQEPGLVANKKFNLLAEKYTAFGKLPGLKSWSVRKKSNLLILEGRLKDALAAYDEARKSSQKWIKPYYYYNVARLFEKNKEPLEALAIYKSLPKMFNLTQNELQSLEDRVFGVAEAYFKEDKMPVALEIYQWLLGNNPLTVYSGKIENRLLQISNRDRVAGDVESAKTLLRTYLDKFPKSERKNEVKLELARLTVASGKYAESVQLYDELIVTSTDDVYKAKIGAMREQARYLGNN